MSATDLFGRPSLTPDGKTNSEDDLAQGPHYNIATMINNTATYQSSLVVVEFQNFGVFVLLFAFSLITVGGNGLVILAVGRERALHTPTNYFVTSLAVSDALVGLVVMPFSAAYEAVGQKWSFGSDWCDAWHSFDVLGSTASILNLCVISLDRYWAITDPIAYPARMTDLRAAALILAVWVCSSAISFPAIAWWRATARGPPPPLQCPFTDDVGYLVFSSIISFYAPLAVMVFTYFKVYKAAAEYTNSLRLGKKQLRSALGGTSPAVTLRIHRGGGGGAAKASFAGRSMDDLLSKNPVLVNGKYSEVVYIIRRKDFALQLLCLTRTV